MFKTTNQITYRDRFLHGRTCSNCQLFSCAAIAGYDKTHMLVETDSRDLCPTTRQGILLNARYPAKTEFQIAGKRKKQLLGAFIPKHILVGGFKPSEKNIYIYGNIKVMFQSPPTSKNVPIPLNHHFPMVFTRVYQSLPSPA